MSYDFWLTIDTGGPEPVSIEPHFNDRHPILDTDGHAGNVLGERAKRLGELLIGRACKHRDDRRLEAKIVHLPADED